LLNLKKVLFPVSAGFGMNTKNEYIGKNDQEWMRGQHHSNPVILVLLVLGSLMVGLIPFAYALTFGNTTQRRLPLERQHSGAFFGEK